MITWCLECGDSLPEGWRNPHCAECRECQVCGKPVPPPTPDLLDSCVECSGSKGQLLAATVVYTPSQLVDWIRESLGMQALFCPQKAKK
jgi:hypothetical protein